MFKQQLEGDACVLHDKLINEIGEPSHYLYPQTAIWEFKIVLVSKDLKHFKPTVYTIFLGIYPNQVVGIYVNGEQCLYFDTKIVLSKSLDTVINNYLSVLSVHSSLRNYRVLDKNADKY